MKRFLISLRLAIVISACSDAFARADDPPAEQSKDLLAELKTYRHKIVYETNRDGNWELYLCNADGSNPVNITKSKDVDESYPKPSPDGTKISYNGIEGAAASVYGIKLMNADGSNAVLLRRTTGWPSRVAWVPLH